MAGGAAPLVLSTCSECGQPLLRSAATKPRTAHRGCAVARKARYQREAQAQGYRSTPAVRAWRQRHPERYVASLAYWQERTQRTQAFTLAQATRWGQRWLADEDAQLLRPSPATTRTLALELGRSLRGVLSRRYWLRHHALSEAVDHRAARD